MAVKFAPDCPESLPSSSRPRASSRVAALTVSSSGRFSTSVVRVKGELAPLTVIGWLPGALDGLTAERKTGGDVRLAGVSPLTNPV
jgi:hypothetical protein